LLVIGGSPTLQAMVDDGITVFEARIEAHRLNKIKRSKSRVAKDLKERYGAGKKPITSNTLLVISVAGLQGLEAAITKGGFKSGWYTVKNGIIFDVTETSYCVGLVADLQLGIRPCAGGHEVWHLEDAKVKATLKPSSAAAKSQTRVMPVPGDGQTLGLKFTPTMSELNQARAGLRPTAAPYTGGVPLWAMSENAKVDLSFLED
jgi:hypothetical protein